MERFLFKWARLGIFHSHQPENRVREVFICKIAFLLSAGLVSQTVCPSLESKVNKKWWESASHAHTPLKHEAVVCGKYFSDLFKLHPTVSGISQGLEVIRFNPFYRLPSNLVPPELRSWNLSLPCILTLASSLYRNPCISSFCPLHLRFCSLLPQYGIYSHVGFPHAAPFKNQMLTWDEFDYVVLWEALVEFN